MRLTKSIDSHPACCIWGALIYTIGTLRKVAKANALEGSSNIPSNEDESTTKNSLGGQEDPIRTVLFGELRLLGSKIVETQASREKSQASGAIVDAAALDDVIQKVSEFKEVYKDAMTVQASKGRRIYQIKTPILRILTPLSTTVNWCTV